jgi:hypothetical protein
MRLPALRHLLQAVQSLARPERIRVLGSTALLASFPDLGEPGGPLELTYDADLLVEPCDEPLAAMLHEAVGEGSLFARRTGYHADILRPAILATLPRGWESRLVKMKESGTDSAAALSPEDLAVVKLRAGRPKDLDLCRALLGLNLVTASALRQRLDETPLPEEEIRPVYERLREVCS